MATVSASAFLRSWQPFRIIGLAAAEDDEVRIGICPIEIEFRVTSITLANVVIGGL